jgi:hypothetical protein
VVETRLRVPGGDVVHRCFAWAGPDGDPAIALEIVNETAAPLLLALSLRPAAAAARGTGAQVSAITADGRRLLVNGAVAARWEGPARQVVMASDGRGDAMNRAMALAAAGDVSSSDVTVSGPDGRAEAVLLWPLIHRSTWRGVLGGSDGDAAPRRPEPDGSAVSRGWEAWVSRSLRLELPVGRSADALRAQQRFLRLLVPDGSGAPTDEALVVLALDQAGAHDEAASVLSKWINAPALPGGLRTGRSRRNWSIADARRTAATVWALAGHELLAPPDGSVVGGEGAGVAAALERLFRHRGLAQDAKDRAWIAAGLGAGADLLRRLGEDVAAPVATAWARTAGEEIAASSEDSTPELAALLRRLGLGSGSPPPAERRADWEAMLAAASPTWCWPAKGWPDGGWPDGDWDAAAARCWAAARSALVEEGPWSEPASLDLLPWWPDDWRRQNLEVIGLPTLHGRLSVALRWHGDRPALLWEVTPGGPLVITASGLDPSWRTEDRVGEALLAEPLP